VDSLSLLENVFKFCSLEVKKFPLPRKLAEPLQRTPLPRKLGRGEDEGKFQISLAGKRSRNLEIAVVEPMEHRNTLWDQCLGL
jgi:hypothetical protein